MHIKLGADPEFFLKKGNTNVSAHGLVSGTKRNPERVPSGAVQLDGTAVEFNIDPAASRDEFSNNVATVLDCLRVRVGNQYEFDFSPSVVYPNDYFVTIPEECKELGCDPDYNAWDGGKINPRPEPKAEYATMRTGAGHLHVGWAEDRSIDDPSHLWDCCHVVRQLDTYFSKYQGFWDKDTKRAKLYGGKGAFRPKPYGVEYRVLSNAWLKYPKLWPWLYDSVSFVMSQVEEGRTISTEKVYYHHKKDADKIAYLNHWMSNWHPSAPKLEPSYLEN